MSLLLRCGRFATSRSLLRPDQFCRETGTSSLRYSSSLSAVWRGIRSGRNGARRLETRQTSPASASHATARSRNSLDAWADTMSSDKGSQTRRSRDQRPTTTRFRDSNTSTGRLPAGRKHFKVKKALKKQREREEEEEEGGRKTRSKRFNDDSYSFGKKSLVYQLNKGDMKDRVLNLVRDKIATPETAGSTRRRPRQFSDSRSSPYQQRTDEDTRRPRPSSDAGRRPAPSYGRRRAVLEELGAGENQHGDDRDHGPGGEGRARRSDGPATSMAILPHTTAASQFLFGTWSVTAALKEAKRKFYCLYVYAGSKHGSHGTIRRLAAKRGVRVEKLPESSQYLLDKASKGRPHNGVVLEASPLPQLPIEALGPVTDQGYTVTIARQTKEDADINGAEPFQTWRVGAQGHKPLVLLLNEILDPGNLGAMLRTARFLGAAAVAVTKQTSSPVTATALKAAAGAGEEVTLFTVADPLSFVEKSIEEGWSTYAAVAPAPDKKGGGRNSNNWKQITTEDVADQDPLRQKPCILVLGNEGEGLSRRLRNQADRHVSIPSHVGAGGGESSVDSLNVSAATALLCDAFTRGARSIPRNFQERLMADAKKARSGEAVF